jgi:hypothetical protein
MRTRIEDELKQLFAERAAHMQLQPSLPPGLIRRARGQLMAGATGATVAVVVSFAAVALRAPSTTGQHETEGRSVRLVAYVAADD